MSSTKFRKLAEKIVKRDKALFDALLEYEKTGKIKTKKRMNFTIDKNISRKFKQYCRLHGYNMSSKIEKAMQNIIRDKK